MVKAEEVRPLREQILRPGRPKKESVYPGDDEPRTLHLVLKEKKTVLGGVSLFHDPRGDAGARGTPGCEVWRVRGMAVIPERRREGLGRRLGQAVQAVVEKRGGGVWANVRTDARPFYEALGWVAEGETFVLKGIGEHVLMTWRAPV